MDFGIEPEEFKEEEMLEWFKDVQMNQITKQTEGIFHLGLFLKKILHLLVDMTHYLPTIKRRY